MPNNNHIKEDIQRGLNDFFVSAGYIYTSKYIGYDAEMEKVLEEYKQEMLQWFTDGDSSYENPMKHVTQAHWYNLYLEKKRLENHGCRVQYAEYTQTTHNPLETPKTSFLYKPDGKYLSCKARQTTKIHKKYIRGDSVIAQEQHTCDIDYYILRAHNQNGLYICPSCGAEQSLDKLLDGCDYCNSKFDISAYADKVTSVTKHNNMFENRTVNESQAPISAIILEILGIMGVLFGLTFALFTCGLSLIFAIAGGFAIYSGFKKTINANRNVPQSGSIIYRLQDYNPGFSQEEFIGSLDCKLKSIHYAANPRELAAFVKCDIAPYVNSYQNIMNCETGRIAYKNFRIHGDYQYLDLHREINVMVDCNDFLKPASSVIKITLAKKLAHKLKNDLSLYKCDDCGATISLLEGGKCKYCGNEMDYATYDWVIVNYQHTNSL